MLHKPAEPMGEDPALKYKTRIGARMFLLYAVVYAGFVILNVAAPLLMEKPAILGMNLAVTYGIGLILFAFILALIYNRMCAIEEQRLKSSEKTSKER